MKAIIEFQLNDDSLSEEELKQKLVEHMIDVCIDWLNGDTVMVIEFKHEKEINDYWYINKDFN